MRILLGSSCRGEGLGKFGLVGGGAGIPGFFFWKLQAYIIAIDCVVRFRSICVVKFTGSVEKKEL